MIRGSNTPGALLFSVLILVLTAVTASATSPLPAGGQFYQYNPVASPVIESDPAAARPIGTGSSATGGGNIRVDVSLDAFDAPVDVYLALYIPSLSPDIWLLTPTVAQPVSQGLLPWRSGVTVPVNETVFGDVPISTLPAGSYNFFIVVTPAGRLDSYHLWQTNVNLYALTIDKFGDGSVKSDAGGIDCGETCLVTFAAGAHVLLTATPADGKKFLSWGDCETAAGNLCAVTLDSDLAVSPTFGKDVVLAPNVRSLDKNTMTHLISQEGTTYTFSADTPELLGLTEGDILIISAGEGALLSVTSVSNSPEGNLVFDTENAELDETIEDGTLHLSNEATTADVQSTAVRTWPGVTLRRAADTQGKLVLDFDNVSIPVGSGMRIAGDFPISRNFVIGDSVKLSGSVELGLGLDFGLDFCGPSEGCVVDKFKTIARISQVNDLTIEVNGSSSPGDVLVAAIPLGVIMAGPVPFVPTFETYVSIYGGGKAKARLKTSVKVRAGIRYTNEDGWISAGWISPTAKVSSLDISDTDVTAYVNPRLTVKVAGIVGPKVNLDSHVTLRTERSVGTFSWNLFGGMAIKAGLDFLTLAYQEDLYGLDWTILSDTWRTDRPKAMITEPSQDISEYPGELVFKDSVDFKGIGKKVDSADAAFTYLWDFGDGTTSTEQNPTHIFTAEKAGGYNVTLTVRDISGQTGTDKVHIIIDRTPPTTPTMTIGDFMGGLTSVEFNNSWDANGIAGYVIFLDGEFFGLSFPALSVYSFEFLPPGYHCIRARAVDVAGNSSEFSNEICRTVGPERILDVQVEPMSPTQIRLSWDEPVSRYVYYEVYRDDVRIKESEVLVSSPVDDIGLTPSREYCYRVIQYSDVLGLKTVYKQSNRICASTASGSDIQAPSVPSGFRAVAVSPSRINLSWNASTDNAGVTGYEVYRSGLSFTAVKGTSFLDTGLHASTLYCYQVLAKDAAGNRSALSSQACATTMSCAFSISPTGESVVESGGAYSITVTAASGCSWTAVSNVSWITITSGSSGNGSGTVKYTVAANYGASRTGTITFAGATFTVTQGGADYTPTSILSSPSSRAISLNAGQSSSQAISGLLIAPGCGPDDV